MATLLIIVIYISFIALGIPDSLFGTAWPAIYNNFNLPISYGSFISGIVSLGTIISSLFSTKLIKKFKTNKVVFISTLLTAIALFGFSISPNFIFLMILAIPLGLGAGSIDVALNNYVAIHYGPKHMNFLHCFYGIGVSISPYILSLVITGKSGWRNGYFIAFIIQLIITTILFISIPIWNKVNKENFEKEEEIVDLKVSNTFKIPGVKVLCLIFLLICTIESICNAYGATFLVEARGFSKDVSARVILLYFIGMAVGRFLSGLFANKLSSFKLIFIGEIFVVIGGIIILLNLSSVTLPIAFFMIGFGNGPIFPNFTQLVPDRYGKEISTKIISLQMTFAYVGMFTAPFICGFLGQTFGMNIFPIYLVFVIIVNIILIILLNQILRKKVTSGNNYNF